MGCGSPLWRSLGYPQWAAKPHPLIGMSGHYHRVRLARQILLRASADERRECDGRAAREQGREADCFMTPAVSDGEVPARPVRNDSLACPHHCNGVEPRFQFSRLGGRGGGVTSLPCSTGPATRRRDEMLWGGLATSSPRIECRGSPCHASACAVRWTAWTSRVVSLDRRFASRNDRG